MVAELQALSQAEPSSAAYLALAKCKLQACASLPLLRFVLVGLVGLRSRFQVLALCQSCAVRWLPVPEWYAAYKFCAASA